MSCLAGHVRNWGDYHHGFQRPPGEIAQTDDKPSRGDLGKKVDPVVVKRRGKGSGFGVNVPAEPLARAGIRAGDTLTARVTKGRIAQRKEPGICGNTR